MCDLLVFFAELYELVSSRALTVAASVQPLYIALLQWVSLLG